MRLLIILCILFMPGAYCEEKAESAATIEKGAAPAKQAADSESGDVAESDEQEEDRVVNLESEDSFIDLSDALKSKHFVRRAILNTAIKNSSKFHLGRPYVNHLVGFNAVIQMSPKARTMYAMQSLAAGYVFSFGLGVEAGLGFSGLSDFYFGTRYVFDQMSSFVWPFVGVGYSKLLQSLSVSDTDRELGIYAGATAGPFFTFGLMIPLVDIGLKAEVRGNLYGTDRIIVTTGLGAVLFL